MNVLILGSGGREHALAWRLSQDKSSDQIFVWPGNDGMGLSPETRIRLVSQKFDKASMESFILLHDIQLVIPGAEQFLYEGVADWCQEWNTPCFGPSTQAAMLEKSKLFSKEVMTEAGIPTARYADLSAAFRSNIDAAAEILQSFERPVIKISGPSLGKGVFVCSDAAEAFGILKQIKEQPMAGLEEGIFVEEGLAGKEISLFYACHGEKFHFLGAAQDHKRLQDNDEGPNTGGMGAYSPVPWADNAFIEKATDIFVKPTLKEMQKRGTPFKGVLFLGLMVEGPKMNLLEYNARFGDPETQTILPLIEGDFTQALHAMASGTKDEIQLDLRPLASVHIVKAARGYPGNFGQQVEKGQTISIRQHQHASSQFFFAGVKKEDNELKTNGGRVLGLSAWDESLDRARELAYLRLEEMSFEGEQFRRDIGAKR